MASLIVCECGRQFWGDGQFAVCPACGQTRPVPGAGDAHPPNASALSPASTIPASVQQTVEATSRRGRSRRKRSRAITLLAVLALIVAALTAWHALLVHSADSSREQLARLPQRRQEQRGTLEQAVRDRHLQLLVSGPASLPAGAVASYRIETKSLSDRPMPARLSVRVLDAHQKVVREENDVASAGEHRLLLSPQLPLKPGAELTLEVSAVAEGQTGEAARLTEKLTLDPPVYVTHLTTDKPIYQPGEVVSFRSLTLERFSLKPAAEDLGLVYTVTDPNGEKVFHLEGSTRLIRSQQDADFVPGPDGNALRGLGAGELAIRRDARGGVYTLTVREVEDRFPLQQRTFIVNRYEKPRLNKELQLTQSAYGPGDTVVAACRVARAEGGARVADQPVEATVLVDGQRYGADGKPGEAIALRTDADGRVQVRFTLPAHIDRGDASLSVRFNDGASVETIVRPIPLVLRKLQVEFFPEGGDPIAGVPCRVYFQTRTPLDRPADFQGSIVDDRGEIVVKDVGTVNDAEHPGVNQGNGLFTFTPQPGRKYELKITSPAGVEGAQPLPAVRDEGVALSIPAGVIRSGEAIRAVVQVTRSDRRLLVTACCRGRLLDQQIVQAVVGRAAAVELKPPAEVGGVQRVTVFEGRKREDGTEQWTPVAERLVYRPSAGRLDLSIQADQAHYVPGERVGLTCRATDEQGRLTPSVLLLEVVDKSVLTLADDKTARTMPTDFHLLTEVRRPEDLEHADFLLSDHPAAFAALDRLLGTQGWRRFAEQAPENFRAEHGEDAARLLATAGALPLATSNSVEATTASQREIEQEWQQAAGGFDREQVELQQKRADADRRVTNFAEVISALPGLLFVLAGIVGLPLLLVYLAYLDRERERQSLFGPFLALAIVLLIVAVFIVSPLGEKNHSETFSYVGSKAPAPDMGRGDGAATKPFARPSEAEAERDGPGAGSPAPPSEPVPEALPAEPLPRAADSNGGARGDKPAAAQPGSGPVRDLSGSITLHPTSTDRRFEEVLARQHTDGWIPPQWSRPAGARQFTDDIHHPRRPQGEVLPSFVVREYAHQRNADQGGPRSDFSETLFWHPVLVLPGGETKVSFDLCDSVSSFQVTAFGHTLDGQLGAATALLEARLPLVVEAKLPLEVTASDKLDIPVAIANNTSARRTVGLRMQTQGLKATQSALQEVILDGNQRKRQLLHLQPTLVEGEATLLLDGESKPFAADSVRRTLKVTPDGFPMADAHSDTLRKTARHEIVLPETWLPGTLKCRVQLYPSPLADIQTGLDAMLREPYGCFEQTSSSSYPNLLVLEYLRETGQDRPDARRRALDLLDTGYRRLIVFECPDQSSGRHGFEWFGQWPPHEALTAYGLLQFRDLTRVYDRVDPALIERTRRFLLEQRDGQGGFRRNQRALDTFGQAPEHITNAYIVWALTSGSTADDLERELAALTVPARTSSDGYFVALVANSLLNANKTAEADVLLKRLGELQKQPDGNVTGGQCSITGSLGHDLEVETTSLAVLAWSRTRAEYRANLQAAARWLSQQRGPYGSFGATQATVLALKALTTLARESKRSTPGEIVLLVNDQPVGRSSFAASAQDVLTLEVRDADKRLKPGKNQVRLTVTGDNELPYTLAWSYQTLKPPSAENCPIRLTTDLDRRRVNEGETVRLQVTVANASGQDQGMTLAIVGLPGGLTLPEDLKQLRDLARPREGGKEPGVIDHWETRGRELILYWRGLAAGQKVEVPLDLVCRVPGEYSGPASRAYLYYDASGKHWVDPLKVSILPNGE